MSKSLDRDKGWQFEEVSWTDMFDDGRVLIIEETGSVLVTSFSSSWTLEMTKYDVMSCIVGLFIIFLFSISFMCALFRFEVIFFQWLRQ